MRKCGSSSVCAGGRIYDETETLQFRRQDIAKTRTFVVLRRHMDVTLRHICDVAATNLRRRGDVADSSWAHWGSYTSWLWGKQSLYLLKPGLGSILQSWDYKFSDEEKRDPYSL